MLKALNRRKIVEKTYLTMEKLIALCKGRGFVYSGSEIYDGLANSWDYGPLGVELKNNIKKAWWQKFVTENKYNVGLDSAILMNPRVWKASGHLGGFSDPLMDCKNCKTRYRADNLIEDYVKEKNLDVDLAGWETDNARMEKYILDNKIKCPHCGKSDFTPIRKFNLMFKTFMGVTEGSTNEIYLRPETAQGIFVNFKNILRTTRSKMPMGVGQIGKSFRNEITPGNFIFRTREFEQMELEFFCKPGTDMEWFEYWKQFCRDFLTMLGLKDDYLRTRDHEKEELSHYSTATTDFEFKFPFGWGELWGIADRTNYDLRVHQEHSKTNLEYLDPVTNEKYLPYVIEPSVGVGRLMLAILTNAYETDIQEDGEVREVLHLIPQLAPFKVAVLPLVNKLTEKANEIYHDLRKVMSTDFDTSGKIGKRYRRQDAIGTPFCVTVDFDSLEKGTVTVRNRDTMEQEVVEISNLKGYLLEKVM